MTEKITDKQGIQGHNSNIKWRLICLRGQAAADDYARAQIGTSSLEVNPRSGHVPILSV